MFKKLYTTLAKQSKTLYWTIATLALSAAPAYATLQSNKEYNLESLMTGAALGALTVGSTALALRQEAKTTSMDDVIRHINENPRDSLERIAAQYPLISTKDHLQDRVKEYLAEQTLTKQTNEYERLQRFNQAFASKEYVQDIVKEYQRHPSSLRTVALQLSTKYGMNVSVGTLSRIARKELGVKNRKAAKERYKKANDKIEFIKPSLVSTSWRLWKPTFLTLSYSHS